MPVEDDLFRLVGEIYRTVDGDHAWNAVLGGVARTMGGAFGHLFAANPTDGRLHFNHRNDFDPTSFAVYRDHYADKDVWLQEAGRRRLAPGTVVRSEDLVPEREFVRTEIYNDLFRQWDIAHSCGSLLAASAESVTVLSIMRPPRQGPFEAEEARRLELLVPHLQRAVELDRRLAGLRAAEGAAEDLVEALAIAVVFLDAAGRVAFANGAARALFRRADGPFVDRGRMLRHRDRRGDLVLQRLVADAVRTGCGAGLGAGGRGLLERATGRPYLAEVAPVTSERLRIGADPVRAAVLLHDPDARSPSALDAFAQHHRLTPAERRLLDALLQDQSVEEIAAAFGVSRTTVRSQLQSLFAKTDTGRQAELVRLAHGYAGRAALGPERPR